MKNLWILLLLVVVGVGIWMWHSGEWKKVPELGKLAGSSSTASAPAKAAK